MDICPRDQPERLLALAEEVPGRWLGIRVAALVLPLDSIVRPPSHACLASGAWA